MSAAQKVNLFDLNVFEYKGELEGQQECQSSTGCQAVDL